MENERNLCETFDSQYVMVVLSLPAYSIFVKDFETFLHVRNFTQFLCCHHLTTLFLASFNNNNNNNNNNDNNNKLLLIRG